MTTVATETSIVVLPERNAGGAFAEELARSASFRLLGRVDSVRAAFDSTWAAGAQVVVAEVATFGRLRELTTELPRAEGRGVVVVSSLPAEAALLTVMGAGARAFLRKPVDSGMLEWAVAAAATGQDFVDPRSTSWLLELVVHGHRSRPGDGLTLRQSQVVALVRGGLTNREIARVLGVSHATVKTHLQEAMRRLGVDNRWAATVLAERLREDS